MDYSLWVVAGSALIGALIAILILWPLRLSPLLGLGIGAASGVLGSLLFMEPLAFCPFRPLPDGAFYKLGPEDTVVGVLLVTVGTMLFLIPALMGVRWYQQRGQQKRRPLHVQQGIFKGRLLPIVLLAPTIIILLMFLYYPAFDTFSLSTQLVKLGSRRSIFVCVDNFSSLLVDGEYLRTILVTWAIGVGTVVIGMGLALAIATVAYLPIKGAFVYRTLLIWPYAVSPAVAGIIFLLLFNPTGGIINHFLSNTLGISIGWLNDPNAAPWAVIIASVWKSLGFNILFFLAGLQNVPKDLLEAASIDGANAVQRYRSIVIPSLSPITFFLIITNMTYAFFETFGTIDYLTGGGPLGSTTTMMYRVYLVGVRESDLGKGAAQSIMLFMMVLAITALQFRTSENRVNYGA